MGFAEQLKALRQELGLTQDELGRRVGISGRVIGFYESGTRFPNKEDALTSIAEHFQVSLDYLLGRTSVKSMFKADQQIPILITYGDNDEKDETVEKFSIASLEADFGYWVQDNALQWIGVFTGDLGLFKSQVNISEGDLVLVKRSSDPEQPIIRFYTKTASQEQLIAANSQYQSINLSNQDHVLGKLVSIVKMNHNYSAYKSILSNKADYEKKWDDIICQTTEGHVSIDHVQRIIDLLIDIDRNRK